MKALILERILQTPLVCAGKQHAKSILSLFVNVALGLASETATLIHEAWRN